MKKFLLILPILLMSATASAGVYTQSQTRAYIQSGLNTNTNREISTGIEMSGDKPMTILGSAEEYNYAIIESITDDDLIDPSASFQEKNESFRMENHEQINKAYRVITHGEEGTRTFKKNEEITLAGHAKRSGAAGALALLTEVTLGAAAGMLRED